MILHTSLVLAALLAAAPLPVRVAQQAGGQTLQVGGKDFLVKGVNWDYVPIGQNYAYSLWTQPDDVIVEALAREMPLLQRMGVNAIRQYVGIPARWVRYIYEKYGIYTVLNHTVGRYGVTLDGLWQPTPDYSNARFRAAMKAEVLALVDEFRGTPGVLIWLLGNENNYGLSWSSFEIEALPQGEREAAKAKYLYSLYGEIARAIHEKDTDHPVAIANGDVQYIDLVASEAKGIDIFGANVYRGASMRDLYQVVHDKLGIPVLFTEFGADAYDAKRGREDDLTQAKYLLAQWRELYEMTAGKGRVGNAIGGLVFQWSDGWWKFGQESRLEIHDTNASWPNAGYPEDFTPGENNMNEEWWGICAKGQPDERGLFEEHPRTAYYVLQQVFRVDPYTSSPDAVRAQLDPIDPFALSTPYKADLAARAVQALESVRLKNALIALQTYSTGGARIDTPTANKGFDHLESFYADIGFQPTEKISGDLALNVIGNVPRNPIDQIFYENRGLPVNVLGADGKPLQLNGLERVKVYRASVSWDDPWFRLEAYHRVGHFHWGYEGDFFGLYREANYGPNIDIYNADVPSGIEVAFKQQLEGLKVAFGPQIWWGANPQVIAKYQRRFGAITGTVVYEDEVARQVATRTSAAVPEKPTRKATLHLATQRGPFTVELGGIWAGSTRVGDRFQLVNDAGTATRGDQIVWSDTLGAKAKVSATLGRVLWYAQGAYMGLVANGGPTSSLTYTGWSLKDSGSGNQVNAVTGLAFGWGDLQIAPNVLWQKPLVGPVPVELGRPRNILDDPFSVRANRETLGAELLLTWDPTPGTWMWAWDNDLREDAPLAASLDLVYRHQPTTQDAGIGILADGTLFAFPGAPPSRDLYEARLRLVSRLNADVRLLGHVLVGNAEPTGNDPREIKRFAADLTAAFRNVSFQGVVKLNDWGPYDYHRDYNLTFPLQLIGDVGYGLGPARWLGLAQTKIGMRGTLRYLDKYSPRFLADPADPTKPGNEYELRTYLIVTM